MSNANVVCFHDTVTNTCQYVVSDRSSKKCAIIDPVLDYDEKSGRTSITSCDDIIEAVHKDGLEVEWILDTHAHADHLSGAQYLKTKLAHQIPYGIGAHITTVQQTFKPIFDLHHLKTDGSQFDRLFVDGETFQIGSLPVTVLHTPGHTPACVSYYVAGECVFVGDTMFAPDSGTGRCDFPCGSAETMWASLQKLLALPDNTVTYMCHDYPSGRSVQFKSTVGEQRATNKHIAGHDEQSYVAMRKARDATLSMPKLILPSIQVNIDGANLPRAQPGDAHAHLKVPLNAI